MCLMKIKEFHMVPKNTHLKIYFVSITLHVDPIQNALVVITTAIITNLQLVAVTYINFDSPCTRYFPRQLVILISKRQFLSVIIQVFKILHLCLQSTLTCMSGHLIGVTYYACCFS